jgi:DNA-binding response OmpR family regulator
MKNMPRVMIVDDEPDIREMINLILSKNGFQTQTAVDGSDFLNKIDEFKPELVTLDVMMPGPMTREILENLKNKKSNPKIILVTVIRYSEKSRKKILERDNVVDIISKPFEVTHLLDTINKHLKNQ